MPKRVERPSDNLCGDARDVGTDDDGGFCTGIERRRQGGRHAFIEFSVSLGGIEKIRPQPGLHQTGISAGKTDFDRKRSRSDKPAHAAQKVFGHLPLHCGGTLRSQHGDQPGFGDTGFRIAREDDQLLAGIRRHVEPDILSHQVSIFPMV